MDDLLLNEFERRIDEIEAYWRHLSVSARIREIDSSNLGEALPSHLLASVGGALTAGLRKTFDYSSVIIALYGSVEDYVERLVEHCIDVLDRSFLHYSELPVGFRKQHERLSLRLADQLCQPGYRGHLNLQTVTENLYTCLSNRQPYHLNREAFSLHGANIRHDLVREMFASLTIANIDQSIESHHLAESLMSELGRSKKEFFFYLDDLADRRNVVAHGERPQDVISVPMMSEYFRAIRVFGEALFETALLGLLELMKPAKWIELGTPTAVYAKGRVVCFESTSQFTLTQGDRVLWKVANQWKTARVESIQVNRADRTVVHCESGLRFGLGVTTKCHSEADYWLVERW